MSDLQSEHARLADLVVRFTEAFNRDDLDGVMAPLLAPPPQG